MSKNRKPVATMKVVFHDDGDATFTFEAEKGVSPTLQNRSAMLVAKTVSQLVASICQSEAIPVISALIDRVAQPPDESDY